MYRDYRESLPTNKQTNFQKQKKIKQNAHVPVSLVFESCVRENRIDAHSIQAMRMSG